MSDRSTDSTSSPDFLLLTADPLEQYSAQKLVGTADSGAISSFIGTTRNTFKEKEVVRLEYECYDTMAIETMKLLCQQIREKWDVKKIAILHRTGVVGIGEASVLIAVSSAHRREALEVSVQNIAVLKY